MNHMTLHVPFLVSIFMFMVMMMIIFIVVMIMFMIVVVVFIHGSGYVTSLLLIMFASDLVQWVHFP